MRKENYGSKKESMMVREENHREHGERQRETREKGPKQEIEGLMKAPKAPGEQHMGGVHKGMQAHMGRAVEHLERDTERGKHAPMIGGHKHDHKTH